MTITQTVEIPADRRLVIDMPLEVPAGKAQVEVKVIPFVKKEGTPVDGVPPKLRLTKKELDEMLQNSPHTQALIGILSGSGDITTEQIREERLAKYLQ